jgi:hypothetical protein
METLARTLNGIRSGTASTFENLTMFPLLDGAKGAPDYLTLDEALERGTARITETSEAGTVPELQFENRGEAAVLLLDGEELIGAKQNRILNLTILAPARQSVKIPVSCVEAGRWAQQSAEFAAAPRAYYATGRARKLREVTHSLVHAGERQADQGAVWRDIAEKAGRLSAASPTSAMARMYERHETDLDAFVRALPVVEGQLGALFAINGILVGLDLFDFPQTLRKLLPKLVRSYALDAVDAHGETPQELDPDAAARLLSATGGAHVQRFPAVGEGEDLRLDAPGVSGAALVARDRIIHLSAFRAEEGTPSSTRGGSARLSRSSIRRRHIRPPGAQGHSAVPAAPKAVSMDALWGQLEGLRDQTLHTATGQPFRVVEVHRGQGVAMVIEPESSGKRRPIYGSSLQGAYRLWVREGVITPSQVQTAGLSQRNSSYVAAVVNAVGPVLASLQSGAL